MSIYIQLVLITLVLGVIMPQKGPKRIYYIAIITTILMFVSAFRYNHLTGDLIKYHNTFNMLSRYDWLSDDTLQQGRNSGFFLLMKLVHALTGGDFQFFLVVISVVINIVLAYVIYQYSPAPWMSFLTWHAMGLFIFGLSSIKQALAMALIMLAFVAATKRKLPGFLLAMTLAGLVHMPALVFLPAYWMMGLRVNGKTVIIYILLGIALYIYKDQFVDFIRSFYYEDDEVFIFSGEIGSRFIMILGFTLFGVLFKGFENRDFEHLFHVMAFATILQMFAGFDNIFTRLADYYFQFSVLYLPMTFYSASGKLQRSYMRPLLPFNARSLKLFSVFICAFMLWFYWTYNVKITIATEVDNYLNFRFMWDVLS